MGLLNPLHKQASFCAVLEKNLPLLFSFARECFSSRSDDMLGGGAAARSAAATAGKVIGASGAGGARASQSARRPLWGGVSSARAARGAQVESAQVDRAEGPKRERILPVLSSYRREAFKFLSGGKWPGAGRRGKLTEQRQRGPAAKKGRHGEANGQLFGLWLHDLWL